MKRNTKNIIMILIVLLSVGTIYLTMNYAKNNIKTVNNQSNNNMSPPSMENTNTPPEKPDEDTNTNTPPEKPSEDTKNETNTTLTWPYYVVFGVLSLIISLIIIHLIMSKFNKKTFKETYENTDKIIIQILLAIILTSSLTYIDKIITDKYFIKKEAQNPNQNIENKTNITYSANEEINEDTTNSNINFNGYKLYVNNIAIN